MQLTQRDPGTGQDCCRPKTAQAFKLQLTPAHAGRLQDMAPALFLRPNWENHSGPLRRIVGATATVSTFVTVEGQPYRPTLAGNGGFRRGLPCLPSSDSIRAVSSPAGRSSCVVCCAWGHCVVAPAKQVVGRPGQASTVRMLAAWEGRSAMQCDAAVTPSRRLAGPAELHATLYQLARPECQDAHRRCKRLHHSEPARQSQCRCRRHFCQ